MLLHVGNGMALLSIVENSPSLSSFKKQYNNLLFQEQQINNI